MRVLHLATNRWWTGSADPVIRLVTGLTARGHDVRLAVVPGDRFEAKAREAGVALVDGFALGARVGPAGVVRDLCRLRDVIDRERIDIVHCHHSHDHWLAVLGRPRRRRREPVPVVRTFHSFRAVKRDRFAAWLYRRTATVFAVSRRIESRCHELGIPGERTVWIPGAADVVRFGADPDPAAIRDELKLGGAPVIVAVARLAPNRGHELLLRAFRELLAAVPDARLLLVGKGENRPRLEHLVADLGLGERVIFTGYRDRDLPHVLSAADCFVLMAAGSDDSCRAALEAMAAGRPVVARRVGALPETIVHGETGLLVEDDRPETVAAALASVLGDPARARAMGIAGRRRAMTEFDPERSVDIVEAAYRRVLAAAATP